MTPLIWIAFPVVATLLAIAWTMWITRERPPPDEFDSMAAHHRFVQALSPDKLSRVKANKRPGKRYR